MYECGTGREGGQGHERCEEIIGAVVRASGIGDVPVQIIARHSEPSTRAHLGTYDVMLRVYAYCDGELQPQKEHTFGVQFDMRGNFSKAVLYSMPRLQKTK
jgi:hypothetical protein